MIQCLRPHVPNAGVLGLIPGQGPRFHILQLRVHMLQLRVHRLYNWPTEEHSEASEETDARLTSTQDGETRGHHPEDALLNSPLATPTTGAGEHSPGGCKWLHLQKAKWWESPLEVGEGSTPFPQTAGSYQKPAFQTQGAPNLRKRLQDNTLLERRGGATSKFTSCRQKNPNAQIS